MLWPEYENNCVLQESPFLGLAREGSPQIFSCLDPFPVLRDIAVLGHIAVRGKKTPNQSN